MGGTEWNEIHALVGPRLCTCRDGGKSLTGPAGSHIVYLLWKVCTRVHTLPYLQFESLLPHIKLSGCKIDVYYSPVMH